MMPEYAVLRPEYVLIQLSPTVHLVTTATPVRRRIPVRLVPAPVQIRKHARQAIRATMQVYAILQTERVLIQQKRMERPAMTVMHARSRMLVRRGLVLELQRHARQVINVMTRGRVTLHLAHAQILQRRMEPLVTMATHAHRRIPARLVPAPEQVQRSVQQAISAITQGHVGHQMVSARILQRPMVQAAMMAMPAQAVIYVRTGRV